MSTTFTPSLVGRSNGIDETDDSRPLRILTIGILIIGAIMVLRLFQRSVIEHTYYTRLALHQQYTTKDIPPLRGIIYATDRSAGQPVPLADNVERFALGVTPRLVQDPDTLIRILHDKLGLDEKKLYDKLTYNGTINWPADQGFWTSPLFHGLTKEQVDDLAKLIDPKITVGFDSAQGDIIPFAKGVHFIREYERVYYQNQLAAQVLGYVNASGEGQYGIEQEYSDQLTGVTGEAAVEQDSRGRLLSETDTKAGSNGNSYVLTIDDNIQYQTEQILNKWVQSEQATSGSVIVLGAKTGAVLAMANNPSFDPNNYSKVATDQQGVFRNQTITDRYEYGSVYKTFTIAAAINEGLTTPTEVQDFPGSLKIDTYTVHNVGEKAYPHSTTTQALEFSVNTAMIGFANRLGSQRLHDYLDKLEFGKKTGVELPGEVHGDLPTVDQMGTIQRATISFGQGVDTTLIQLATAYTAITNQGTLLKPHIIDTIIHPDGTKEKVGATPVVQVFTPQTAQTMLDMLTSVVQFGHAREAIIPGYKVGGKTGTAQIPDPAGGYYDDSRTRHTFAMVGPSDNPQFIILFTLEWPKKAAYAESSVTPASTDLMKYLLSYYQIPPTNR